jgi:hypothetical protein
MRYLLPLLAGAFRVGDMEGPVVYPGNPIRPAGFDSILQARSYERDCRR